MEFLCIACMEKRKSQQSQFFILPSFFTLSLSPRKSMQRSTTLFPPSKQRLHKSLFLQKLSFPKRYWDQARLSSLVNKQVVSSLDGRLSSTVRRLILMYNMTLKPGQKVVFNCRELNLMYNMTVKPGRKVVFNFKVTRPDVQQDC